MKIGTYDDKMYCKRMHPQYPGKPIDSARFTFLDLGSSEGESNITLLRQKDTYLHGYKPGKVMWLLGFKKTPLIAGKPRSR